MVAKPEEIVRALLENPRKPELIFDALSVLDKNMSRKPALSRDHFDLKNRIQGAINSSRGIFQAERDLLERHLGNLSPADRRKIANFLQTKKLQER